MRIYVDTAGQFQIEEQCGHTSLLEHAHDMPVAAVAGSAATSNSCRQ
jgi:hypothetical protein